jgi:heme-degrading monooxygenase HmoA
VTSDNLPVRDPYMLWGILVRCRSGAYGTLVGMVLEVTLIDVLPGREDDFVDAYEVARPLVATAPGCRSVRLRRAVESPQRFVLLAEWDSLEAHEQNFRRSDRFAQ